MKQALRIKTADGRCRYWEGFPLAISFNAYYPLSPVMGRAAGIAAARWVRLVRRPLFVFGGLGHIWLLELNDPKTAGERGACEFSPQSHVAARIADARIYLSPWLRGHDAVACAVHELGHALGLDDTDGHAQAMNHNTQRGRPSPREIKTVRAIYDEVMKG